MSLSEVQNEIVSKLKRYVSQAVEGWEIQEGVMAISTPFLDWKGTPITLYAQNNGLIEDGEQTINQLDSLGVIEDLTYWPYAENFFQHYGIRRSGSTFLMADTPKDKLAEAIVLFGQGIARLPGFFKPDIITTPTERYPFYVRHIAREMLGAVAPKDNREDWLNIRTTERKYVIPEIGLPIESDMNPVMNDVFVQIISHATKSAKDQRQHVQSKLMTPALYKEKKRKTKVKIVSVLASLTLYPAAISNIIDKISDRTIQTDTDEGKGELLRVLSSSNYAEV